MSAVLAWILCALVLGSGAASLAADRPAPCVARPGALCVEREMRSVNLGGADLRFADFSQSDLREANLAQADLSDADMDWTRLERANLSRANLAHADLKGADLRGADLSGANLTYTNLRGADLRGADLTGARMQGANLRGADVRKAQFDPLELARAETEECLGCPPDALLLRNVRPLGDGR